MTASQSSVVKVSVITFGGKQFTFDVKSADTIASVKKQIQNRENLAQPIFERTKLCWENAQREKQQLNDDLALSNYTGAPTIHVTTEMVHLRSSIRARPSLPPLPPAQQPALQLPPPAKKLRPSPTISPLSSSVSMNVPGAVVQQPSTLQSAAPLRHPPAIAVQQSSLPSSTLASPSSVSSSRSSLRPPECSLGELPPTAQPLSQIAKDAVAAGMFARGDACPCVTVTIVMT